MPSERRARTSRVESTSRCWPRQGEVPTRAAENLRRGMTDSLRGRRPRPRERNYGRRLCVSSVVFAYALEPVFARKEYRRTQWQYFIGAATWCPSLLANRGGVVLGLARGEVLRLAPWGAREAGSLWVDAFATPSIVMTPSTVRGWWVLENGAPRF